MANNHSNGPNDVCDVTIIGAGPTGLFGAFYVGMRHMSCKIIDALPEIGGQLAVLYPEKLIYDVAGHPKVLAKDLVKLLWEQVSQWHPTMCLGERATTLTRAADHWVIGTDQAQHKTRTVVIAAGIGAFSPKKIDAESVTRFEGKGVYYFIQDKKVFHNKRLLIVGGGDSAVDWALNLKDYAKSVTMIHRRDGFRAHESSVVALKNSTVDLRLFHELKEVHGDGTLTGATIFDNRTKAETTLEVDYVLLNLGFNAALGPLAEWGMEMIGKRYIKVNGRQATSLPGVYAAGDIAAKEDVEPLNLIATGFGDATVAVNYAYTFVKPGAKVFPGHSSEMRL